MNKPETIEIGARRTPAETVKHVIYPVSDQQKSDLLLELLKRVNFNSVLIFCRTKHGADRIAGLLKRNNHAVGVLHSNRTQRERGTGPGRTFAPASTRVLAVADGTSPRADSTSRT